MTEPILKDPRELYHTGKFADQDQHTPALQDKMLPEPDCGEGSYVGNHLLENRRVLITGGDSGIGRAAAIAYAREGADVAIQFFPGEERDAKEVAEYIEKAGRKAVLLPYDLRDESKYQEIIEGIGWSGYACIECRPTDCAGVHFGIAVGTSQRYVHSQHHFDVWAGAGC